LKPILPGSTIGILGSGQLGRMFTLEAKRMGYYVHTFSPDKNSPTGQVADEEFIASYDDAEAARKFAEKVDVVTFEFENIASKVVEAIEERVPVHPSSKVLHITQHRLREKTFLKENGFPVTPFYRISTAEDIDKAIAEIGTPSIVKTAGFGYDGKGQAKITTREDLQKAFVAFDGKEAILEAFVDFDHEVSVGAARSANGDFADFGVVRNIHTNHILDTTYAFGNEANDLHQEAIAIAKGIMETIGCIGVLCIEMFVTTDGKIIVNELAPRPHNSGHWTIDGCITNQFEQQVRAVCGLPLGSTKQHSPAAMVNILGNIWNDGEPDWNELLKDPNVKLHLYGKAEARKGRKMGHVNIVADTAKAVEASIKRTKQVLRIA
jgi:5-(carboxyamino)imidazole ribonucleotide synthase